MSSFSDNLQEVNERIAGAAHRAGRSPDEVTLVAVTKNVEAERAAGAVAAGIVDIGENRVQEAQAKAPCMPPDTRWHLVGHLQRNKARHVVGMFSMVHSLDSLELGAELDRRCAASGVNLDVLIQVNMAREPQKFGVHPEAAKELLMAVSRFENLRVMGMMVMAPLAPTPEASRQWFRQGRELAEELQRLRLANVRLEHLSMGMSGDFEVAIEEGATMVRIGSALFGPRQ